jgi:hypothetical protein
VTLYTAFPVTLSVVSDIAQLGVKYSVPNLTVRNNRRRSGVFAGGGRVPSPEQLHFFSDVSANPYRAGANIIYLVPLGEALERCPIRVTVIYSINYVF